ncbi:UDP-2,3-diacylglucosamine diphosphatase [Sphingomicrobium sp. XHP0239]|uniref:UDP-2,3-diacylglucosamine diphosphatase n=1 Tax=Sphingomicrobium maritimum TaxID=3133972 RepID=UPI0031CC7220
MFASWLDEAARSPESFRPRRRYRTVFISDTHLGTPGCNAELLHDFLRSVDCDTLYLVGDIIDGWRLKKGWYWPPRHNDVVRTVLKHAQGGTRVVFIPGNHDELFRDYIGLSMGGIELAEEEIHVTADGRKLWVLHGDRFDGVVKYHKWLAYLGDHAYSVLLKANIWVNRARRLFGKPYWSLSAYLKLKVKNAVTYIGQFETVVAEAALERGVDGVVCGHIHHAEIRQIGAITYHNDGDWVESCTALVEDFDGHLSLLHWADEKAALSDQVRERTTAPGIAESEPAA